MPEIQMTCDPPSPHTIVSESTQRSLDQLASVMIELSQHQGLTPVVVTPACIIPEPIFFQRLASTVRSTVDQEIRFDWFRKVPHGIPLLNDLWAMRLSRRINRELKRCRISHPRGDSCLNAALQITPMLARPGGRNRQFVIGWADTKQKLPNWAAAIYLFDASGTSDIRRGGQREIIESAMAA